MHGPFSKILGPQDRRPCTLHYENKGQSNLAKGDIARMHKTPRLGEKAIIGGRR